uniref:Uncharacterized protein n=1 Tax=Anguilla anguilla TaxID=7936 RepID=A0A0E9X8T8_ANGAN
MHSRIPGWLFRSDFEKEVKIHQVYFNHLLELLPAFTLHAFSRRSYSERLTQLCMLHPFIQLVQCQCPTWESNLRPLGYKTSSLPIILHCLHFYGYILN